MPTRASLCVVVCAGLLLAHAPCAAQDVRFGPEVFNPRPYMSPTIDQASVGLSEAVRLTVLFSPAIARATQSVERLRGQHQTAGGNFDGNLVLAPRITYITREASPFMIDRERSTRESIARIADQYTYLTVELKRLAASLVAQSPRCPMVGESLSVTYQFNSPTLSNLLAGSVYQDQLDEQEKSQIGATSDLGAGPLPDFRTLVSQTNFCQFTKGPDPLAEAAAYYNAWDRLRQIDFWGSNTAGSVIGSLLQIPKEGRLLQAQLTETIAARARLAVERLGPLPLDEIQRQFWFDATYTKPFRNGLLFGATAEFASGEQSYKDKPLDPGFGGFGVPVRFPSEISAGFMVPLGKGRGSTSVQATERATAFAEASQREQLRHLASEEVLRTLLAYFEVVAMQETIASTRRSADIVERVRVLTEQLVTSGELPAVERNLVAARAAWLKSLINATSVSLIEARAALAEAVGAGANGTSAQLGASDGFATAIKSVPAAPDLIRTALAKRADVRAVAELTKAAQALDAGARADVRRRVDAGVKVGISNLYESPYFRYLPDEEFDVPLYSCDANRNTTSPSCVMQPGHSTETPVRFYSVRGFARSITKRWEPFVEAQIKVELPFGNNAARGRAKQTAADASDRAVQEEDLRRVIGEHILSNTQSLRTSATAIDHAASAVTYGDQLIEMAVQQFRAREATLIDTLLTEEQVTQDRLSLIRKRQVYLSLLARLKFETGDLLSMTGQTLSFDAADFIVKQ
jgi:outer membrane protein TolC